MKHQNNSSAYRRVHDAFSMAWKTSRNKVPNIVLTFALVFSLSGPNLGTAYADPVDYSVQDNDTGITEDVPDGFTPDEAATAARMPDEVATSEDAATDDVAGVDTTSEDEGTDHHFDISTSSIRIFQGDSTHWDVRRGSGDSVSVPRTDTVVISGITDCCNVTVDTQVSSPVKIELSAGTQIDMSTLDEPAISVVSGSINLSLNGGSLLAGGARCAALQVPWNARATIEAPSSFGFLTARAGSDGAAIGGGRQQRSGDITIISGTITANANTTPNNTARGAGIGSGFGADGGTVTIAGGNVTARGGADGGAGIGGGCVGAGGTINISGGNVTACGGAGGGAGIGGGYGCGGGVTTVSNSAVVYAEGAGGGHDIGGGDKGGWGTFIVNGISATVFTGSSTKFYDPHLPSGVSFRTDSADINAKLAETGKTGQTPWANAKGVFALFPIDLTITADSTQKAYDGTPLTDPNWSLTSGPFMDGDSVASINVTGSQTEVGSSPNVVSEAVIKDAQGHDVTSRYAIKYVNGTLTVTKASHSFDIGIGNITITSGPTGYWTVAQLGRLPEKVNIKKSQIIPIGGASSTNTVTVNTSNSDAVKIAISNLYIGPNTASAFSLVSGSNVDLTLVGVSTLRGAPSCAGLEVSSGSTIDINGAGSLSATGGVAGAGIGSRWKQDCGTINISGGTVTATGNDGAGIGGGAEAAGGTVNISGGTVVAIGGINKSGAGIGGGAGATSAGTVNISGGTVTATGGNSSAAGIGGGGCCPDGTGGNVSVSGGTVTASGGQRAAGIGGGFKSSGGTITVSGGTVIASGGEHAAGIGGGEKGSGGTITVSGGTVTASGGKWGVCGCGGAGIGSGNDCGSESSGGTCNISGGQVAALGGRGAAGVGGGTNSSGGVVTVSGSGSLYAQGGEDAADIGAGGYNPHHTDAGSLNVDGVHANVFQAHSTPFAGKLSLTGGAQWTVNTSEISGRLKDIGLDKEPWSKSQSAYLRFSAGYTFDVSEGDITIGRADDNSMWLVTYGEHQSTSYVPKSEQIIITGSTSSHTISVDTRSNDVVKIKLDTVNIDVSGSSETSAFNVAVASHVALRVYDDNVLKSGLYAAGLQVPSGASVSIWGYAAGDSLTARGGSSGAGIGGGKNGVGGDVTIAGAEVNADGGYWAAGIGGGENGYGGIMVISDGKVNATGGAHGSGIGGGSGNNGGVLTVSGGEVNATGGAWGAGIGGGIRGDGGRIALSGGSVSAVGGTDGGAGIGGGNDGSGAALDISGSAIVYVEGTGGGADIGAGKGGSAPGTFAFAGTSATVFTGGTTKFEGVVLPGGVDYRTDPADVEAKIDAFHKWLAPWDRAQGVYARFAIKLTVTASSASKVYDGDPLVSSDWELTSGTLVDGDRISSVGIMGAQTNAGSSENVVFNAIIVTSDGHLADPGKYDIAYADGSLKVEPRPMTVTAASEQKVYDGLPLTNDAVSQVGLLPSDALTAKTDGIITDVGQVANSVDSVAIKNSNGTDVTENYEVETVSGVLTIQKRDVVLSAASASKVYDGTALRDDRFTSSNLVVGDVVIGIEVSGSQTEVGFSANTISRNARIIGGLGADVTANYRIGYADGTLTVTEAELTVIALPQTKTYDSQPFASVDTAAIGAEGLADGDNVTAVRVAGSAVSVGAHEGDLIPSGVVVKDASGKVVTANYMINYRGGDLFVASRETTITAASASKTYDGTALRDSGFTSSNLVEGDVVSGIEVSGSQTEVGFSANAITGQAKITNAYGVDVTANYQVSSVDGTLEVMKAPLTVTVLPQTKTYDGQPFASTDASAVSAEGLADGDGVSTIRISGSAVNVGTHEEDLISSGVVIGNSSSADVTDNYRVTYVDGTLEVTKAALTVTVLPQTKTYDGQPFSSTDLSLITTDGLAYGDNVTAASIGGSAIDVGTYPEDLLVSEIAISNGSSADVTANYEITPVAGELLVGTRAITVGADSASKTYDGTELRDSGWSLVEGTLAGDDDIDSVTVVGSQKNVGASANDASGAVIIHDGTNVTGNYEITYLAGTLEVTKADLTVAAQSRTKTYDGVPFASADVSSVIATGLAPGDVVSASAVRGSEINVGTYPEDLVVSGIVISNGAGDDVTANYAVATRSGALTVAKAPLTITADSSEKPYDGTPLEDSGYTAVGLVALDEVSSLAVTGSQTEIGSSPNVASAAVVVNASDENVTDNYAIEYYNGVLSVVAGLPTFDIGDGSIHVTGDGTQNWFVSQDGFDPVSVSVTEGFAITGTSTSNTIAVGTTGSTPVKITLRSVSIDVSEHAGLPALNIANGASAELILASSNTLKSGSGAAGVQVNPSASVSFRDADPVPGAGIGSLVSVGGSDGAGIGGGSGSDAGAVSVSGYACLYAQSGSDAADIGAGAGGSGQGSLNIADTSAMVFTAGTTVFPGSDIFLAPGLSYKTDSVEVAGKLGDVGKADQSPWNASGGVYADFSIHLTVTASSAYKAYDGTALTSPEWELTAGSLVDGDDITGMTVDGSQTAVGSSDNVASAAVITNGGSPVVVGKYSVTYVPGVLTVGAVDPRFDIGEGSIAVETGEGDFWKVTQASRVTPVAQDTILTITGTSKTNTITVDTDNSVAVDMILDDVDVDASGAGTSPAFDVVSGSTVALGLSGTNTLKSPYEKAGLQVPVGARVTIDGDRDDSLLASGGVWGSGIGCASGPDTSTGIIAIAGGTVVATGGWFAAGIGGGSQGDGGAVSVSGDALVYAQGGWGCDSDIGGGAGALSVGSFTIVGSDSNVFTSKETVFDGYTHESVVDYRSDQGDIDAKLLKVGKTGQSPWQDARGVYGKFAIKLTVTASSATQTYNGRILESPFWKLTSGYPVDGDDIVDMTVTGAQTDVGSSDNVASDAVIVTSDDQPVPDDKYEITYVPGTLTVNALSATIHALSKTKTYDGKSFRSFDVADAYLSNHSVDEHLASILVSGSAVSAGVHEGDLVPSAAVIRNSAGTDVTHNYDIHYQSNTLTIDKAPLSITADSAQKPYDGTALEEPGWKLTGGTLVDGERVVSVVVSGSQTNAGSSSNVPSNAVIKNHAGVNVASNYDITYGAGTLTVSKLPLSIRANSAIKGFDGSALEDSGWKLAGGTLVDGERVVSVTVSGSQASAGSSPNTPSNAVIRNAVEEDVSNNYDLAYASGTLTVTPETPAFDSSRGSIRVGFEESNPGFWVVMQGSSMVDVPHASAFTITGTSKTNTITVDTGSSVAVDMILDDVDVDASGAGTSAAFAVVSGSNVALGLSGTNTLKSPYEKAGLQVPAGACVTIDGDRDDSLLASGGVWGSGIGCASGPDTSTGTIAIAGGTVVATGGWFAAGIGGGSQGDGGAVSVSGDALVYAQGGWGCDSDIGGGAGAFSVGSFTIVGSDSNVFTSKEAVFNGYTHESVVDYRSDQGDIDAKLLKVGKTGQSPWQDARGVYGKFAIKLTVTASSATQTYNGRVLESPFWQLTSGYPVDGDDIVDMTVTGAQTDVGSSDNVASDAVIVTSDDQPVPDDKYEITYVPGTLTVNALSATIHALSKTKTYDGKSFRSFDVADAYLSNHSVDEHLASILVSGSAVSAGVHEGDLVPSAAVIRNSAGTDVTHNYDIHYQSNTLTIDKAPLSITAADESKTYDGEPFSSSDTSAVSVTGLVSEDALSSVEVAGTAVEVGIYPTDLMPSAAVVSDSAGDVATGNYDIAYNPGALIINHGLAEYDIGVGSISVADGGGDFWAVTQNSSTDNVSKTDGFAITGSSASHTITVDTGNSLIPARITLRDVSVDVSITPGATAFNLVSDSRVDLLLSGSNSFISGSGAAGVEVSGGGTVSIDEAEPMPGVMDRSLVAVGGEFAAGIGGGEEQSGGTLSVDGAVDLYFQGGFGASDIGAGAGGSSEGSFVIESIFTDVFTASDSVFEGAVLPVGVVYNTDLSDIETKLDEVGKADKSPWRYAFGVYADFSIPLTVTASSDWKIYDGTELTSSDWELTAGSLIDGDEITSVAVEGSQTDVGSSPNIASHAVITNDGQPVAAGKYEVGYIDGSLTVTSADSTFDIADGSITVVAGGIGYWNVVQSGITTPVAKIGTIVVVGDTSENTITVDTGIPDRLVNIRLSDVSVDVSSMVETSAFVITPDSSVSLESEGENTLVSGMGAAGLRVPVRASVSIEDAFAPGSIPGSLHVIGGVYAAGVGGNLQEGAGDIDICGSLIATGGVYAAGIGGGYKGDGGTVVAFGNALVYAQGGTSDSDIGAGTEAADAGSLIIEGSTPHVFTAKDIVFTNYVHESAVDYRTNQRDIDAKLFEVGKTSQSPWQDAGGVYGKFAIKLTIAASSASKVYDGTSLESSAWELTDGALIDGDLISSVAVTGSQTDVGASSNTASDVVIVSSDDRPVADDKYEITYAAGTLTVEPRPVAVIVSPQTKVYDGLPLTSNTVSRIGLLPTDSLTATTTGTITNVGQVGNFIDSVEITDASNRDVSANYQITSAPGTLTVTQRETEITAASASKTYDGTALVDASFTPSNLVAGDMVSGVEASGSQTDVGSSANTMIGTAKIMNDFGVDVTSNYQISYQDGSLTVIAALVVPDAPAQEINTLTIPTTTGVIYSITEQQVTGTVHLTKNTTVTARPAAGYEFPPGTLSSWSFRHVPVESDLDGLAPGTTVICPKTAMQGATITVRFTVAQPGEQVDVYLFSEPVPVGSCVVGADRTIRVTLPEGMMGSHKLAAYSSEGEILGWDNITIVKPLKQPPTGDSEHHAPLVFGMLAISLIVAVVAGKQQRKRRR